MKRPTELIEKAKGFKSTDPIRVLAEYIISCETQPPRKTVSDDCEDDRWYDGKDWPEKEFEAEAERRKGGEVFRLVGSSDLVKVVYEGRDGIVCVANEDNDIFVVKKEDLRKRKPISKAEAWDKAVNEDVSPFYILENYEVK